MSVCGGYRDEALRAFKLGILSLGERAEVDTLFEATCARIHDTAAGAGLQLPDALRPCGLPLSAMYHVNFSGESNQPTASPVALRRSIKQCLPRGGFIYIRYSILAEKIVWITPIAISWPPK